MGHLNLHTVPPDGWHRIFITRHAQSINTYNWRWNLDHPQDTPRQMVPAGQDALSPEGKKQVIQMSGAISRLQVRHVLSAPSVRCIETAAAISNGNKIVTDKRLLELKLLDYAEDHKENPVDQVQDWLDAVFQCRDGNTLVVSHSAIMAKALQRVLGLNDTVRWGPAIGSVTTLDWHPESNRIVIHELGSRICPSTAYWHNEDAFRKL